MVPSGPIRDASRPAASSKPETSRPHTSSTKLEDQAALAALYVTNHDREQATQKDKHEFLDSDHKLSSAGKLP